MRNEGYLARLFETHALVQQMGIRIPGEPLAHE